MSNRAALLAKAAARRAAPPPSIAVAQMRKDKKEAIRMARLKQKAKGRGQAPKPGQAPAPVDHDGPKPAGDGKPLKVGKYRASKAYAAAEGAADQISYPEGATLFVMGEPDDDGLVMAVYDGKSGNCKFDTLSELTAEILAAERAEKEAAAERDRLELEAAINGDTAALEKIEMDKLEALDEKYRKKALEAAEGDTEAEKMQSAASAAAAESAAKEIDEARAAEDEIKKQAAELERLMAELDMTDDEDED